MLICYAVFMWSTHLICPCYHSCYVYVINSAVMFICYVICATFHFGLCSYWSFMCVILLIGFLLSLFNATVLLSGPCLPLLTRCRCPCFSFIPLLTHCYCPCLPLLILWSCSFLVHIQLIGSFASSNLYCFWFWILYWFWFWYLTKLAIPYCHTPNTV